MMKFNFIIAVLLLCFISCDYRTSVSYFNEAYELESQGQYEQAILLLNKAIERNPENLGALINRGSDKSALGLYNDAIADYDLVIDLDPENTLAIFNKANNLKRLERFQEAIQLYNKAIELKGGGFFVMDYLENSFVNEDEFAFDVPSVEIKFEQGLAYYEIDSVTRAYHCFDFCVRNDYLKKESLGIIGSIYFNSGQESEGCEYWKKSSDLGDENSKYNLSEFCK